MDHIRLKSCTNPNCNGCVICNCFVCSVCGLFEGSLTTDCPGEIPGSSKDYWDITDKIYRDGNLDFRDGKWVNEPNPTNQFLTTCSKRNPTDINE